jgi:hypothetical protein
LMSCLISKTKFKLRSSIMLLFMDSQTKTKNFIRRFINKKSLENKFSNHSMKPLIRKIILLKQSLLTKILLNYGNRSISKSKRNHKNF